MSNHGNIVWTVIHNIIYGICWIINLVITGLKGMKTMAEGTVPLI